MCRSMNWHKAINASPNAPSAHHPSWTCQTDTTKQTAPTAWSAARTTSWRRMGSWADVVDAEHDDRLVGGSVHGSRRAEQSQLQCHLPGGERGLPEEAHRREPVDAHVDCHGHDGIVRVVGDLGDDVAGGRDLLDLYRGLDLVLAVGDRVELEQRTGHV